MCVATNNKYVNAAAGLYGGSGAGGIAGLFGDTGAKSRHPRRTFANAEGQTSVRMGNQRFQGILADPAAVESLLATGKAPRKGVLGA